MVIGHLGVLWVGHLWWWPEVSRAVVQVILLRLMTRLVRGFYRAGTTGSKVALMPGVLFIAIGGVIMVNV